MGFELGCSDGVMLWRRLSIEDVMEPAYRLVLLDHAPHAARVFRKDGTITGGWRGAGDAPARRLSRCCGRVCAVWAALSRSGTLLTAFRARGRLVAVRHVGGRRMGWCRESNGLKLLG